MIDARSRTWEEVTKRSEAELTRLREMLEGHQDEISTTRTRERIRAFKDVLSWAIPPDDSQTDEGVAWRI